jgi:hypothetical protein
MAFSGKQEDGEAAEKLQFIGRLGPIVLVCPDLPKRLVLAVAEIGPPRDGWGSRQVDW